MDPVWFKLDQPVRPDRGQQVLVVIKTDPPRRYKRQIRTAIYQAPGEWYVHGNINDCGYYDEAGIERWTSQPELPKEDL